MLLGHRARLIALVAGLAATAVASFACSGGTVTDVPQKETQVVSSSGLHVRATIASASLGESYSGSNLQLAFVAGAAPNAASIEITSVVLVDMTSGAVSDVLTSSLPRVWNGSSYVDWNQKVTPGGDLRASYTLSTPNWAAIDGAGDDAANTTTRVRGSRSYSTPFRLRITMKIDGAEVVLESSELHREPVAMT